MLIILEKSIRAGSVSHPLCMPASGSVSAVREGLSKCLLIEMVPCAQHSTWMKDALKEHTRQCIREDMAVNTSKNVCDRWHHQ